MENQTVPVVTPQVVVEPKGNNFLVILLSILLFISVAIAGFFALQTQKLVSELTVLRSEPTSVATVEPTIEPESTNSATTDPTVGWKKFESNQGVLLKYPTDWVIVNNMYISQKNFDAYSTERRSGIYNVIEIHKFTSKLVATQLNNEWFESIFSGPEIAIEQGVKRTRIETGKVKSGESYFVVRNQAGNVVDQIRAYIIKNEVIYEFVFSDYDQLGLDLFKLIVLNVTIL
jgi:hypothetical protein